MRFGPCGSSGNSSTHAAVALPSGSTTSSTLKVGWSVIYLRSTPGIRRLIERGEATQPRPRPRPRRCSRVVKAELPCVPFVLSIGESAVAAATSPPPRPAQR